MNESHSYTSLNCLHTKQYSDVNMNMVIFGLRKRHAKWFAVTILSQQFGFYKSEQDCWHM